jgi:magnesium-transporting ATPase (P-type)
MSILPEASLAAPPATSEEAPPRGALVLAGFNIALTAWLLVSIGHGLAIASSEDAFRSPHAVEKDVWPAWAGGLKTPMWTTFTLGVLVVLVLVIVSVVRLVGNRWAPRTFRVLLGSTIALALVAIALYTLVGPHVVFWGSSD